MSQMKKFQVPYKSPGNHVTEWVQQTCHGQKTPQNQIMVKTPQAPKKINPKKKETSGTPKTPTFKLYGIKSPCRRRIILDGRSRFSFKSPKSQNVFSQSTTPGYTPAQFIANFRAKIGDVSPQAPTIARSPTIDATVETLYCTEDAASPFTVGTEISEAHNHTCAVHAMQEDRESEHGGSSHCSQFCSVFDLPLSPESQQRIRNRNKTKLKQAKAKEYVLKVLHQTGVELQELRRKHRSILLQLGAAQPEPPPKPGVMVQRRHIHVARKEKERSPIKPVFSTRRNSSTNRDPSENKSMTTKQREKLKISDNLFKPSKHGPQSSTPTEE